MISCLSHNLLPVAPRSQLTFKMVLVCRKHKQLLERAATFEAIEAFEVELTNEIGSGGKGASSAAAASLAWIRRFLEEWRPRLMGEGFRGVPGAENYSVAEACVFAPVSRMLIEALELRPPALVAGSMVTKGLSGSGHHHHCFFSVCR